MRIKEKSKGLLNIFKSAQTPVAVRNHKLKPAKIASHPSQNLYQEYK